LVTRISKKTGISKVEVRFTLEGLFREIKEGLYEGENIYLRGFGSFVVKKRAKKIGRNIRKNIAVEIPAHYIPSFKPAKTFVNKIKNSPLLKVD